VVCGEYYPECGGLVDLGFNGSSDSVGRVGGNEGVDAGRGGDRGDDSWKLALMYLAGLVFVIILSRMRYKKKLENQ